MAEKRYSPADLQKMARDKAADLRAKGADVREITPVHPGGMQHVLKELTRDISHIRDQSQAQTEHNRETMKQRAQEVQQAVEARKQSES
jgi:hypothetical protein